MKVGSVFTNPSLDFYDFVNVVSIPMPEPVARTWLHALVFGFRRIEPNTLVVIHAQLNAPAVAIFRSHDNKYYVKETHFALREENLDAD